MDTFEIKTTNEKGEGLNMHNVLSIELFSFPSREDKYFDISHIFVVQYYLDHEENLWFGKSNYKTFGKNIKHIKIIN